jgi:hypothetical protein
MQHAEPGARDQKCPGFGTPTKVRRMFVFLGEVHFFPTLKHLVWKGTPVMGYICLDSCAAGGPISPDVLDHAVLSARGIWRLNPD